MFESAIHLNTVGLILMTSDNSLQVIQGGRWKVLDRLNGFKINVGNLIYFGNDVMKNFVVKNKVELHFKV